MRMLTTTGKTNWPISLHFVQKQHFSSDQCWQIVHELFFVDNTSDLGIGNLGGEFGWGIN